MVGALLRDSHKRFVVSGTRSWLFNFSQSAAHSSDGHERVQVVWLKLVGSLVLDQSTLVVASATGRANH
jgi:hypothetical protein